MNVVGSVGRGCRAPFGQSHAGDWRGHWRSQDGRGLRRDPSRMSALLVDLYDTSHDVRIMGRFFVVFCYFCKKQPDTCGFFVRNV